MKNKILISACLLGEKVKYNGGDNALKDARIAKWRSDGRLVSVCPEVLGGMSTPRVPSEVVKGTRRVISKTGEDVTHFFEEGAKKSLHIAQKEGVCMAILKARSPSCGKNRICDGTFSGTKAEGMGIACAVLQAHGLTIFSEEELDDAEAFLEKLG